MGRTKRALGTAATSIALVVCASGVAVADVEPNNAVFQPEGPILAEGEIAGTVSTTDRDDWYVFYVEGVHQLHFRLQGQEPATCGSVRLTDRDGLPLPADYTSPKGTTRFFVHAQLDEMLGCPSLSYAFRLDPAAAFAAGPGRLPIKGAPEPNDVRADANGPLAPAAWYFSSLETVNDEDWFRFYTRPGRQRVEVEIVTYGDRRCFGEQVSLHSSTGRMLTAVFADGSLPIYRLRETVSGGQRLYVHVVGSGDAACVGRATVVQVGSDEAVMTSPEVRATCAKGRRGERSATRLIAADRRALARLGRLAPRSLERKLARDRRALRTARRSVRVYCS